MYASPEFTAAYTAACEHPPLWKGVNAYDIHTLLVWAYEQHPKKKPPAAELKQTLLTVRDRAGAVGRFSIDADGNSTYTPVRRTIAAGQRKLTARWDKKAALKKRPIQCPHRSIDARPRAPGLP